MSQFAERPVYIYQPTDTLLPWLYSLLGAALFLYPLRVVTWAWLVLEHPEVVTNGPMMEPPAELMGPVLTVSCAGCLELVVWVAWYALFVVWTYRAAVNARALGAPGVQFSPRVCMVGVLPVVNLVMAPVVMSDLVLASEGRQVRGARVSPMVLAWWGCLSAALLVMLFGAFVTNPMMFDQTQLTYPFAAVQVLFGEAYLVLTLLLVRRVQAATTARLGAYHEAVYGRQPEPWEM